MKYDKTNIIENITFAGLQHTFDPVSLNIQILLFARLQPNSNDRF